MSYYADLKAWFSGKGEKFWTAISILLIIVIFYYMTKNIKDVDVLIRNAGVFGPLVALAAYVVFAPTPISTDPLTAFTGVLFGPVVGILIGWIGNTLGAFTEYFVGHHLSKNDRFSSVKDKLPFGLNRLPFDSPYVLIFGRAIPGYGGKVINFMSGVHDVSIKTFTWTTVLINLIGATLLSFGGYSLIRLIHLR